MKKLRHSWAINMNKQKILIIEDETVTALNTQNMLEMKGDLHP